MNDNLKLYNAVRKCPENALKEIKAGRLKGMSDINPMWRIQMLILHFWWNMNIKNANFTFLK